MAILLYVKITNPNNVEFFPPSIKDSAWYTDTFLPAVNMLPAIILYGASEPLKDSVIQFFESSAAVTAHVAALTLPEELQSAQDEWKSANSLSVSYQTYSLSASGDSAVSLF